MASVLEQAKAAARIAMYLIIAYFAIKLWQDPYGSAQATMNFIQGVGRFFASVINKVGVFARGLSE
jgi:hypothetical protein